MNNLVKKNIIYSLSSNYDMPYDTEEDISLKANQIIYTSINNNFQKLVDNDLYTEKRLLDRYNYPIGPEAYSDSRVSSSPDGYKIWDGMKADTLSILHKHENDISSTVYKLEYPSGKVNFFYENGGYMAGTNTGLYVSKNGTEWIKSQDGIPSDAKIISYYDNLDDMVFLIGTDKGLYQLSNYEEIG